MTSQDAVAELALKGDVPALIVPGGGDWREAPPAPAVEAGNGSPIEEARRQHAALLGEDADRVRTVRLDLDALLTLGTLVDVDVRGLSLFTAQSTWEDLGITESDVRRERFSRPMIYLLPKKVLRKFNTLGARARNNLANHSFDVTGFRPWRWIPFTAYRKWRKLHRKLTGEWDAARQTHIQGVYGDLLEALERDLREVAAETYATLAAGIGSTPLAATIALRTAGDEPPRNESTIDGLPDQGTFTGRFVNRLMVRFPTRQAIEANLRLDYSTAALINPAMVEAELAARDQVRRAREAESEVHRREQQLVWERADAEGVELQARQEAATYQIRMHEMEEQQRRDQLEEMRKAEMEHYREQLQEMTSPMRAVFNQLRAQVYDDAQAVAASLRKHGTLIGASSRRARNMCQTFRLLDALDDQELNGLIAQIEGQLEERAPERDLEEIEAVMNDVVDLTHEAAVELETMQRGRGRWAAVQALSD